MIDVLFEKFLSGKSGARKGKAKSDLEKQCDGTVFFEGEEIEFHTRKNFIYSLLNKGFTPETKIITKTKTGRPCKEKTIYELKFGDDYNFSLSKTEYEFASFLVSDDNNEAGTNNQADESENIISEKPLPKTGTENFNIWLMNEAELYENEKHIKVLKDICLAYLGEYHPSARTLLVLIDNINDQYCKENLIKRLAVGNMLARVIFEHITGLTLPLSNAELHSFISNITKDDFLETKDFVIREEEKIEENNYQIRIKDGYKEVTGFPYEKYGLELFLFYTGNSVSINEKYTGLKLIQGTSEEEAKNNLKNYIDEKGIENLKQLLENKNRCPMFAEK